MLQRAVDEGVDLVADQEHGSNGSSGRHFSRRIWGGGGLMALGLIVLFLPVVNIPGFGVVAVAQARGICSGTLAPTVPIPAAAVCTGPGIAYVAATVVFLVGVALLSWGIA